MSALGLGLDLGLGLGGRRGGGWSLSKIAQSLVSQYIDGESSEVVIGNILTCSDLAQILSIAYPQIVVHEALLQYDDDGAPEVNSLFWAFEQEPLEILKQIGV